MTNFQITLLGFHADTDETDHLIKWIEADNVEQVKQFLTTIGIMPYVESIDIMSNQENLREGGIDVVLEENKVAQWIGGNDIDLWLKEAEESAEYHLIDVTVRVRVRATHREPEYCEGDEFASEFMSDVDYEINSPRPSEKHTTDPEMDVWKTEGHVDDYEMREVKYVGRCDRVGTLFPETLRLEDV